MSRFPVTPKTLPLVLARLTVWALSDDQKKPFCKDLNLFLDDLVSQDAFGTEAQCDPRGDQRD